MLWSKDAVQKTEEKLKENNELFCLGELVHNGQVMKKLKDFGLKIVEKVDEAKKWDNRSNQNIM